MPNANAVAAQLCARLSFHLDRADLRAVAEQTISHFGQWITRAPRAFASMLLVVDLMEHGPVEIVIVGPKDAPETQALVRATASVYLPQRVLARGNPTDSDEDSAVFPLLRGKSLRKGQPTAYVCRDQACSAPITDPEQLRAALSQPSG